ncbi:hypothetical protein [Pseudodesulfovibrio tunisiensis]|uniref:hypothetical protein n=1 Tax=Pseudodesulfovibrio tunisiensis TaxID=463192 RepID=UPI001FB27999|nr:hypothetical protein [Pseudodesulfovibrio tunisiensis]
MKAKEEAHVPIHKTQAFAIWIACLIAAFLYHAYLNYGIYFASGDDFAYWMTAESTPLTSKALYLSQGNFAERTGRFYYQYTTYLNIIDKLMSPPWLRAAILGMLHIAMPVALGFLLHTYTRKKDFLLLFIPMALFAAPIYSGWHMYYHWAVYYKISFLLFVIGEILYYRFYTAFFQGKSISRSKQVACLTSGAACLFLGSLSYEVYLVGYAAISFFLTTLLFKSLNIRFTTKRLAQALAFKLPPLLIYLALYVGYGISVGWGRMAKVTKLSLAPDALAATIGRFFSGSLPVNPPLYGGINYIFPNGIFCTETIGAIIVSGVAMTFLWSAHKLLASPGSHPFHAGGTDDLPRPCIRNLIVAFLMYFIVSLAFIAPLAITERYQNWLSRSSYYLPTFYLSLFLLAFITYAVAETRSRISRLFKKRTFIAFSFLIIFPIAFISIFSVNLLAIGVHKMNVTSNAPWILLRDAFKSSPQNIFNNATGIMQRGFITQRRRDRTYLMFKAMTDSNLPFYMSIDELIQEKSLDWNGKKLNLKKPLLLIQHFGSNAAEGGMLMISRVSKFIKSGQEWIPVGRKGMIYGNIPLRPVHYLEMKPHSPRKDFGKPVVSIKPTSSPRWYSFHANADMELDFARWTQSKLD